MSMARNWMFNYPCLSKRDEIAKFQFERNSKWILGFYSLFQMVIRIPRPTEKWMHLRTKKYLFCFKNHLIRLQSRDFLLHIFQEVRVGPIKSKLPYMASTCCCDLLLQLNWPIPRQVKTTWYFNQQVTKPKKKKIRDNPIFFLKEIKRFLQFSFEVND